MINLYAKREFRFPVEASCISPDIFQGKTTDEIEALQIWEGKQQKKFGELFKVEMNSENRAQNPIMTAHGDLREVRRIGSFMKSGELIIRGNAGMHLGEEMKGGNIKVYGNAEGWTGSMMTGGTIEVSGNCGDYLGAPYRGSANGMKGGKIIIHGNVGNEAGAHMKKGTIKILGNAGQFLGFRMKKGTIYVQGDAEGRAGACMTGGKIVTNGHLESVLPTFTIDSIKAKVKIEESESANGPFYLFLGDLAENGEGKLYVSKEKNPHLKHYERFLEGNL